MRNILFFLLLTSGLALAEDWTTTNGTSYKQVTVLSHDDAFVTIMYADGGARIPLRLLDPELQARFGYDAKKAAADEAATVAKDKADHAALIDQEAAQPLKAQQSTAAMKPVAHPAAATVSSVVSPTSPSPPFNAGFLQNGDFANGDSNWQGDGQAVRSYTGNQRGNPDFAQGLLVTLDSRSWTKIYQTFEGDKTGTISIAVTYRVSQDISLSKNPDDYHGINKKLGMDGFEKYGSFSGSPGEFYGTVGNPTASTMSMEVFQPKLGSTEIQTYQHTYPPIPLGGDTTFALCFPPGTGTVDILTVKVFNP